MTSLPAPEILRQDLATLDLDDPLLHGLPPRSAPEFASALIARYMADFERRGLQAAVAIIDGVVHGLALPQAQGHALAYVLGLVRQGAADQALPLLQTLDLTQGTADIAYNLGVCLAELGRPDEALAALQKSVRLDPGYLEAHLALGSVLARLGRNAEAESVLRTAVALGPEHVLAQRHLALALARNGRFDEALPLFRRIAALAATDPAAQIGLAQCLEQLGGAHLQEAVACYRSLLERFPRHAVAAMARQGLQRLDPDTAVPDADLPGLRQEVIAAMEAAFERYAGMDAARIGQIIREIALLGRQGLHIDDTVTRHRVDSLGGEFPALELLCHMHVGYRLFDSEKDIGTGLEREYQAVRARRGAR